MAHSCQFFFLILSTLQIRYLAVFAQPQFLDDISCVEESFDFFKNIKPTTKFDFPASISSDIPVVIILESPGEVDPQRCD